LKAKGFPFNALIDQNCLAGSNSLKYEASDPFGDYSSTQAKLALRHNVLQGEA